MVMAVTAAVGPVANAGSPTVTIWHAYGSGGSFESVAFGTVLADVQGRYPGITIAGDDRGFAGLFPDFFENAGTGVPDLMVAPNDYLYFEKQFTPISDLTSIVRAQLGTLQPEAVRGSTVDRRYVQLPESLKAIALYYDRVAMPTPPTTTGQLMAALQAGTRIGMLGLGGGESYFVYGLYGAFGGRILNGDGRCIADQTPGVAQALAYVRDAVATGNLMVYPDSVQATDALKAGDIKGLLDGNWRLGDMVEALGDELGVVTGPAGPGGPFQPLVGVDGYVVNAASPNADAALAIAKAMTDRAAQETFMSVAGHVPADKTIAISDPQIAAFALAAKQGVLRPMNAEFFGYFYWFQGAYDAVVYGGANPTVAVAAACAGLNADNAK
jgi:arabinogalactan oligomer / maltooligosaccharide transport system substrate-binding protein